MKKYYYLAKSTFMQVAAYRASFLFAILSNIIYIFIIYYLWRAIYSTPGKVLSGMTFGQTFAYLSIGSSVMVVFSIYTDWVMGRDILTGRIVSELIKPVDYQMMLLSKAWGEMINRVIFLSIPALFIILFVLKAKIPIGINLVFFLFTLILSFLVNFGVDFITGVFSFYTQSTWGIFYSKGVLVSLLSGALIPVSFFPEGFQRVINFLPFQAIYNVPLKILTTGNMRISEYISMILVQFIWIIVLTIGGRLFYKKSLKVVTVNGG